MPKNKRNVTRNFSPVKSEMDALMRKSKLALMKGKKDMFPIILLFLVHSVILRIE